MKRELGINVLQAARDRVRYVFDHFEAVYISFSGGKDSSVMFHLVMDEARRRGRRVGVLVIDLEAQYALTIKHVEDMLDMYAEHVDPYWVCLPIKLRNSVSNYEPVWCAWDPKRRDDWVRPMPQRLGVISDPAYFDFFEPWMEFEEFIELFAVWYAGGRDTAAFIGIRTEESLNRWRTIARWEKETHFGKRWTTQVVDRVFNAYPIYDWKVSDIWAFHAKYPKLPHNEVYDRMHLAGVSLHQMRLCQPYGDDQKRGLWLYHLIEPQTWGRVVARVNGANSGALYIEERGNVTGYNKITLPPGHTWKSFCNLLLATMPEVTREHYTKRFRAWLKGWHDRGYRDGIPDYAPPELEKKYWAPSWRRMCKVLLRNDWWCKGLGLTQPKSEAYQRYMTLKKQRTTKEPACT
jgi:predicted phosphoadenosine phosphosulfate sulfurtransferase